MHSLFFGLCFAMPGSECHKEMDFPATSDQYMFLLFKNYAVKIRKFCGFAENLPRNCNLQP